MKQLSLTLVLSFLASIAFSQSKSFPYSGEKRRYTIYLPTSYYQKKDQSFPVVFNFHGGGMTMIEHMFYSRMNEAAEKHQFIVVYPQGIKQDWNVGFEMSYQYGTDDIGFIKALLTSLSKEHRINKDQIYATGLSRGGFFAFRLAAELPETFAAVASVGAPLPDSVAYFHNKRTAIGVMLIQGDADQIVKYDGKEGAYKSAFATYAYWKKHNGLEKAAETRRTIDVVRKDSTSVQVLEAREASVSVSLVSILGGGHTWPGSNPFNIGFPLGRTSQDVDVNDMIWRFFSRHKRRN